VGNNNGPEIKKTVRLRRFLERKPIIEGSIIEKRKNRRGRKCLEKKVSFEITGLVDCWKDTGCRGSVPFRKGTLG